MAYRIEVQEAAGAIRVDFQGALDRAALAEIGAIVAGARARRPRRDISLVLEAGTEVDPECIAPLRRLDGVTLRPVSPFLARWLGAT
jgi:hypothetical protein